MVISNEKTVGELAAEIPAAARVFEKYGIDYCCGGKHPVETACRERGIAPEQVLEELEQAAEPKPETADRDWNAATLRELVEHILAKHHAYLKTELPRLEQMFAKVVQAHGAREPRLAEAFEVYGMLKEELESHMMKEEMILFPAIVKLETPSPRGCGSGFCGGSIQHPIARMEHEHDDAGRALQQMRHLTFDYLIPDEACNTYRALFHGLEEMEADLHQHIHLENNILFPRAAALESA
ncbi:MAG TPA: iron-sulfur cluster repair di-iron protein [Bryobacteraceae bacterium]|nr:iron-sulfur cluster repair di-iron protein [Bryobacteraceae bacterium]